jgi:hypothetical protein
MKIINILAIKNRTSIENSLLLQDHFVYTYKSSTNICILIRLKFTIKNSEMKDIKIGLYKILLTVTNVNTDIPLYLHN